MKQIVVSGARPTGKLHIGNYFGAVANFVKLQHEVPQCFFFVADWHSLTTHHNPAELHDNVRLVLAQYLGCGLDPEKCTIYNQSDVPQVAELYLYLNMYAYVGELERCTTYKDKVAKHSTNINAGLLTYPTLMAADIIIHKGTEVPVGEDQLQHLEMARNFTNRFNHLFGVDYFPEPQAYQYKTQKQLRIPALNGMGKMSKSDEESSAIYLMDTDDILEKKIKRAVTDSSPTEPNTAISQPVQNILDLMKLVSTEDAVKFYEDAYANCTIRYGDMKKQLAEDMKIFIKPIRERIEAYHADTAFLNKVAREGAAKAQESAQKTIKEVREIIGLKPF